MKLNRIFGIGLGLMVWYSAHAEYPGVKIYDQAGQAQPLTSEKNKLLVVLWATWCPDCKVKLKGDLKTLQSDKGIQVLALNAEKSVKRVNEFIKDEGVVTPVAFDKENEFRKSLQLFTVPAWAVFEKKSDGKLVLMDKGSPFDSAKVNQALGKKVFN